MQNLSFKFDRRKMTYIALGLLMLFFVYRYRMSVVDLLKPFVFATIIAYLLNPMVLFFEKKGLERILSVILVFLLFISAIVLFSVYEMPKLMKDIGVLIDNIPAYTDKAAQLIRRFQDSYLNSNLPQSFKDMIDVNLQSFQGMVLSLLQNVADGILDAFSQIFNIILTPILAFYMLKDTSYFKSQMILLIPRRKRNEAILLFRDIDNVFGRYIRGQITVAIFVGVLTTLLLMMVKVKYALVLGIFAGISNIIPYFGPFIGLIPTVAFALMDSPIKAVYAAGCFLLVQQVESGILSPKIIGDSVGIHPIYVIFALILGGKVMGVLGLILAVPVLAAVKMTLHHVLRPKVQI